MTKYVRSCQESSVPKQLFLFQFEYDYQLDSDSATDSCILGPYHIFKHLDSSHCLHTSSSNDMCFYELYRFVVAFCPVCSVAQHNRSVDPLLRKKLYQLKVSFKNLSPCVIT